jgi:serine/threonine protein kinase
MCLDLVPGGELLSLITLKQTARQAVGCEGEACDLPTTVFYISEIIEAMEYLSKMKIVHRDLKPESKCR